MLSYQKKIYLINQKSGKTQILQFEFDGSIQQINILEIKFGIKGHNMNSEIEGFMNKKI